MTENARPDGDHGVPPERAMRTVTPSLDTERTGPLTWIVRDDGTPVEGPFKGRAAAEQQMAKVYDTSEYVVATAAEALRMGRPIELRRNPCPNCGAAL